MELESKEVEIGGVLYTVQEISIGEMMPILPRLDGDEAQQAQMDMMKLCIFVDGSPLGDGVSEIGFKSYLKLAMEVMEVNGIETPGKD